MNKIMIQWHMKYWFSVSHIPDQIRIWKCCFLRRQEKNKDKPQRPLSWLSESVRQDIGQFHSFIHEALSIGGLFYQGPISIL